MASLAFLVPLYPSLCALFSSLLMIYLYRRNLRRVCPRFTGTIFWEDQDNKQRRYTRLDDMEVELESGLESENEFEIQSEDIDDDEDGGDEDEDEDEEPAPFPELIPNPNPPSSPLSIYFNAQTTLIHPHLLSPTAPPTPGWERRLRRRIDEGRGLGAWKDRLVERTVRWLLSFS